MLRKSKGKFVGVSFPAITIPLIGRYSIRKETTPMIKNTSIAMTTEANFWKYNFQASIILFIPALSTTTAVIAKKYGPIKRITITK
jgi:hypothetical protein